MTVQPEFSAERSLALAKQVPFVFWPLIALGGVLTISIWFAPVGLPILALSAAMLRMASTARRNDGVWNRGVRPTIAALALVAIAASVLALRAAIEARFDFTSDASAPALVLLLLWTGFIATMCVSVFRRAVLQPRRASRPSAAASPLAVVSTAITNRTPYWPSSVLAGAGILAVLAGLITIPVFLRDPDDADLRAIELLGEAALPGLAVAIGYVAFFTRTWRLRWRIMVAVGLGLGFGTVRLMAWAAHFVDNSSRTIPMYVSVPLLLVVVVIPPLYRRSGRWITGVAAVVLILHLIAAAAIGFDASRCEDDDCIPARATYQLVGIGSYWTAIASVDRRTLALRLLYPDPTLRPPITADQAA